MRDYVILLLFVLIPFAFIAPGLLHAGHQLFFVLSALIIIAFLCENKWITLFLIYIVFWQLWLFVEALYFPGIPTRQISRGFTQTVFALSGACVFYAISNSKIKIKWFYNIICITAIVQSLLAVCQQIGFDPVVYLLSLNMEIVISKRITSKAIVGTLGNQNFLAAYLAISLPFFFRKTWFYFIPVIVVLLFLSKTSSAVLPAIVGTMVFFGKIKWVLLGVVPLVGYAIYDQNIFTSDRYQFWMQALKQLDSPVKIVFGLGPGASWGKPFPLHSEWVTILHQFGIIGFSLIIGFVATIYRSNRILFSAFVIACINMGGNYPLHLVPSAFLIIIIVGLMQREVSYA